MREFFSSRWRGRVPLARLLWRDMALVGTAINVAAGGAGLLLLAQDAPTALAATVYFAPSPYNVFLVCCVWRLTACGAAGTAAAARAAAAIWLTAATLI